MLRPVPLLMFLPGLDLTLFKEEGLNLQPPSSVIPGSTPNAVSQRAFFALRLIAALFCTTFLPLAKHLPSCERPRHSTLRQQCKIPICKVSSGEELKVIWPSSVGSAAKQLQGDSSSSLRPGLRADFRPGAVRSISPPPAFPKIVGGGGREAPRMCSTPYISHQIVATVPTITTGRLSFACAPLEPTRCAISGNDNSERGILMGIPTYEMQGGRSLSPYLLIQEYLTRSHTTATITTGPLPLSTHDRSVQVQTCFQRDCNLFGLPPRSPSFLLPSPSRTRSGAR